MQSKIGCGVKYDALVQTAAKIGAKRLGREKPNIEDQMRVVLKLMDGLCILDDSRISAKGNDHGTSEEASQLLDQWKTALNKSLHSFMKDVIDTERIIKRFLSKKETPSSQLIGRLGGFFLPFASRPASRERSHIFTTNYDRLIEYGCDILGLRVLDRFVGNLEPVFRSTRLGLDFHYNPPGIRGEPRYLDGVVHLTKLHGSLDWRYASDHFGSPEVYRCSLPFGALDDHPEIPSCPSDYLLIYPNPAKDVETLEYPYAELFRDFAAAVCRPNTVIVTYGYGFGDDHVNRILRDMLSIPSTHLVMISYDDAEGRLPTFYETVGHKDQISLLIGSHFGDLSILVDHYWPKPVIEPPTLRMADLMRQRAIITQHDSGSTKSSQG